MSTRRAHWAMLAGLLWLFGFDVVPLAHVVFHEALEEHHHGHHHEQAHSHEHEEEAPSQSEHGEGSVAHRDLAATVPLPGIPEVLGALLSWDAPTLPTHDERNASGGQPGRHLRGVRRLSLYPRLADSLPGPGDREVLI